MRKGVQKWWQVQASRRVRGAPYLPRYSIERKISVVMMRQVALGLMVMSPVMSPTSPNSSAISRYFWLDSALMGDVYTTRCPFAMHLATAYSATAVLPAEVCAETRTDSLASMHSVAYLESWAGECSRQMQRGCRGGGSELVGEGREQSRRRVVERDRRTGGCRNDQKSGAVLAWTKNPSFCAESLSIIRGKKVSKSLLCGHPAQ